MTTLLVFVGTVMATVFGVNFFGDQLLMFVMMGKVPFTSVVLSPMMMILFWILLIPGVKFLSKVCSQIFWIIIELIGNAKQRRINYSTRRYQPARRPEFNLMSIYMLRLAEISKTKRKKLFPQVNQNYFVKVFSR